MNTRVILAILVAVLLAVIARYAFVQDPADKQSQHAEPNATGAQDSTGAQVPATLALLVGINNYAPPSSGEGFETLHGAENDVQRAHDLLTQQFGFDPATIETLIGPQATHAAIVAKFDEHLIQKAGPDTRVVFWFSGHGSLIPDASGKDPSARDNDSSVWDETLIAYDSRQVAGDGSYDIADDELFTLLGALKAKDVVVVTDCCHSGGALRGGSSAGVREAGFGSAGLDRARIETIWPKRLQPLAEDDGRIRDLKHVVQIAACDALEQAGEIPTPDGVFGTCTWFLGQALRVAGPETTWAEVVERTRVSALDQGTKGWQRVQLIGDGRRRVMGGRGRPSPPGFSCELHSGRGSMTIAAGTIHGIGLGARMRLVDYDQKPLGFAVVVDVKVSSCKAKWEGSEDMPKTIARAQPETFGDEAPAYLLRLDEGVAAEGIANVPFVKAVAGDAAEYTLTRDGEMLAMRDRDGDVVRTFSADPEAVQVALTRERYWRSLWHSVVTPGQFPMQIKVEKASREDVLSVKPPIPSAKRLQLQGSEQQMTSGLAGVHDFDAGREKGSLVKMQIRNLAKTELHVALISVGENREIHLLYGRDKNNVVGAGAEITKLVWLGRATDWPAERAMIDRYLVIATPRYTDFRPFEAEQPTLTRSMVKVAGMPPILREALDGTRTRGEVTGKDAPMWGITSVDLQLVTPAMFDRIVGR